MLLAVPLAAPVELPPDPELPALPPLAPVPPAAVAPLLPLAPPVAQEVPAEALKLPPIARMSAVDGFGAVAFSPDEQAAKVPTRARHALEKSDPFAN